MGFWTVNYERAAKVLPAKLSARADSLRPSLRDSWGGPLNGQEFRRAMVRDIAHAQEFDRFVETGTYRGTSTEFFYAVFGCPIHTVEANERFFLYSRQRLAKLSHVEITLSDSRSFLRDLATRTDAANETVFIYLDAHWEQDLPLREELAIIAGAWPRAVVMIDDFQVPDDPGYAYDDYGQGKALVADYLPDEVKDWTLLYPAARSETETGAKRGSCVLVSPALADIVAGLSTLRKA